MGVSDTEWKHLKTDGRYRIIGFCIIENGLVPAVMYRKAVDEAIFIRPCEEFFDGRFRAVPWEPEEVDEENDAAIQKAVVGAVFAATMESERYDPNKPLEVNWEPEDYIVNGNRVEDSQGTALRVGDLVRLENELSELKSLWPSSNPLTPTKIRGFDVDGAILVSDKTGLEVDIPAREVRFVSRPPAQ